MNHMTGTLQNVAFLVVLNLYCDPFNCVEEQESI